MTLLLTCKDFLQELNDYLDGTVDVELRQKLQRHINECPNCWVIFDTSSKTIQVYKGMEPQQIPQDVHDRLMLALQKKMSKCSSSE
jgi:anti-sigma factor (TIGR02949 family)